MNRSAVDIKAGLKAGRPSVGSWMQIPDASVAEIMGAAGYDWVAVDLEHGVYSPGDLPGIFRALEVAGTLPIARVGQTRPHDIKIALEAGAKGLIFPMIHSREDIENAIQWSWYPPAGQRGVGYSRASLFGKRFTDHLERCNRELILVAQIESQAGAASIREIVQTPGLDAVMVGPYDLSASMGITGQFDHPEFKKMAEGIRAAARDAGVAMGMHVVQPEPARLRESIAEGNLWVAYATDAIFLYSNADCPAL